jgi:rRNA maturation RNase YbeY
LTDSTALTLECTIDVSEELDLPVEVDEASVSGLVRFALEQEHRSGSWVVSFAFVTEAEISQFHDQFLGDPAPTDIITFPFDEPDIHGGDVAICLPIAAEQGQENGNTLAEELYFLVLHGVLHLVGYDDETPEMRSAMLAHQEEIYGDWRVISR